MRTASLDDRWLFAVASAPPLPPPQRFTGTKRYRLVEKLGEGTFGIVHEAVDAGDGGHVALKLLRRSRPDWVLRFQREFELAAALAHPNLVKLHALHQEGASWFITMELVRGVSFLEWVRARPWALGDAMRQLRSGVTAMHAHGLVHCDLKPANVRVTAEGRVVILDFGLTTPVGAARCSAGTPAYMSPRARKGEPAEFAADWFAVDVMLREALSTPATSPQEWETRWTTRTIWPV